MGFWDFFSFFLSFVLCRAATMAYGGSPARGQLELQLPAYTTATKTWDLSRVCDLHHNSQQCRILNPLSKARDQTHNLMVPSWIHFCCTTKGTPRRHIFKEPVTDKIKITTSC